MLMSEFLNEFDHSAEYGDDYNQNVDELVSSANFLLTKQGRVVSSPPSIRTTEMDDLVCEAVVKREYNWFDPTLGSTICLEKILDATDTSNSCPQRLTIRFDTPGTQPSARKLWCFSLEPSLVIGLGYDVLPFNSHHFASFTPENTVSAGLHALTSIIERGHSLSASNPKSNENEILPNTPLRQRSRIVSAVKILFSKPE